MTRQCLASIALAVCGACARQESRSAPPAGDTTRLTSPVVVQAGDTASDDDRASSACLGKGDTIEVRGPTIIATVPSTVAEKQTAAKPTPKDSAAADSVDDDDDGDSDGNEADTDFVLMALGACKRLHTGGVTMYVNNYSTRMIRRRGVLSPMSFNKTGFVFLDTTGVRHYENGFLGEHRMLALSDSLFGTKLTDH